uniref:Uncharacterized protein n=1 Tax=Clastoptera arizonana TaxID=38151 RepID=A0A1B6EGV2_9HEMI
MLGTRESGVGAEIPQSVLSPDTQNTSSATFSSSTNADTDRWTDSTGNSTSECDEEYLKLPEKIGSPGSPIIPTNLDQRMSNQGEYSSLSSVYESQIKYRQLHKDGNNIHHDTRSQLEPIEKQTFNTSEDENMIQSFFSKIVPAKLRQGSSNLSRSLIKTEPDAQPECSDLVQPCPSANYTSDITNIVNQNITNDETWSEFSLVSDKMSPESDKNEFKGEVWTEVNLNDSSPASSDLEVPQSGLIDSTDLNSIPGKLKPDTGLSNWISRSSIEQSNNSRRQSLDSLILGGIATGERVKEILSQSIMKLNISSLKERRLSEPKLVKSSKKVPSPLEKSMTYLNPDDESTSDSESLASVEMLTDDQISSLMLEQDLHNACQEVLGSPVAELPTLDYFVSSVLQS